MVSYPRVRHVAFNHSNLPRCGVPRFMHIICTYLLHSREDGPSKTSTTGYLE